MGVELALRELKQEQSRLESELERVLQVIRLLEAGSFDSRAYSQAPAAKKRGRKQMTAEQKAKIAEAQARRWAKQRKTTEVTPEQPAQEPLPPIDTPLPEIQTEELPPINDDTPTAEPSEETDHSFPRKRKR